MAIQNRQDYNPNQAGYNILTQCNRARKILLGRLIKPSISDEEAFEAYTLDKIKIVRMDYWELMSALKSSK